MTSPNPSEHAASVCISRDWKRTVGCLYQLPVSCVNGLCETSMELFAFVFYF